MKILYTCTYSSGISGVWNRVYNLALEMIKKGHQVYVFSSNLEAGTLKQVPAHEVLEGIQIFRFPAKSVGSKNAFDFSGSKEAMKAKLSEIKPDIIDCQTFRHSEGNIISKEATKLKIPCVLTTHAPFVSWKTRGIRLSVLVSVYDAIFSRRLLKRFKKIIAISNWEIPYLKKLGVEKEKIQIIPNGIPEEFFKTDPKKGKGILFLGRIAPVKSLETAIRAVKNTTTILTIAGPAEEDYKTKLQELITQEKSQNIKFFPAVYKIKEKIKLIDSCDIFVLPSVREGMPQALIEAMSRGKIAISSGTDGGKEIIKNKKNGFLFKIKDSEELKQIIETVQNLPIKEKQKIQRAAIDSVKDLKWSKIAEKLERVYIHNP